MDVSIIFVNWNSADFLRECLASIYDNTSGVPFEVIVVDNASFDGAEEMLRKEFPRSRYIQSDANLGFARANNLGAKNASGEFLLFLNPDTLVLDNAITKMAACLRRVPHAGALGCRILNRDHTIQTSAVQSFPTVLNQMLDADLLRNQFPHSTLWGMAALYQESDATSSVDMVSGACLMIKAEVFRQIGGFSEEYFMYGEDIDLCRKVHEAGRQIFHVPTAKVIHFGGQSTKRKRQNSFSTLLFQESMTIYFRKFRGKRYAALYKISRVVAAILRLALLHCMLLFSRSEKERSQHHVAVSKWWTILRWSLGLIRADGFGGSSSLTSGAMFPENMSSSSESSKSLV